MFASSLLLRSSARLALGRQPARVFTTRLKVALKEIHQQNWREYQTKHPATHHPATVLTQGESVAKRLNHTALAKSNTPTQSRSRSLDDTRNENDYVFRHVQNNLSIFWNIGDELSSLPVGPKIKELNDLLTEKKPSDEKSINDLVEAIKLDIKTMNQQELAALITVIKDNYGREWATIIRAIDFELRWLLKQHVRTSLMDLDLWLYLANVFYRTGIKSKFALVLNYYLFNGENYAGLNDRQLINLLFYVIIEREQVDLLQRFENRFIDIVNTGSFEDIATIAMAYFKTKTIIPNKKLLQSIVERTTELLPSIDPSQPGYCSIIKSVRYSCRNRDLKVYIENLINALKGDYDDIIFTSKFNMMHTLKLMEASRIHDKDLLDRMFQVFVESLDQFRIKDIQYILTSFSNFAYEDLQMDEQLLTTFDKICEQMAKESRYDQIHQPMHVIPLMRAFAMYSYYNAPLIHYTNDLMTNPDTFRAMKKTFEFDRSVLLLYVATRMEGSKAVLGRTDQLSRLSSEIDRAGIVGPISCSKTFDGLRILLDGQVVDKSLVYTRCFRDIARKIASSDEFREDDYNFETQFTFPHQNFVDLVISKGCKAPGGFDQSTLMPVQVPAGQRQCLLYATRLHDYVDGYERLSGYKRLVSRLYRKLGYSIVYVDLNEPDIMKASHQIKQALNSKSQS